MTRQRAFHSRLRIVAIAALLGFTTFAVSATPASVPLPRPEALAPQPVAAASYCASEPLFSGRLTASSSSTTAVSRITSGNVYPYISKVDVTWSCTASWRYSGVAWNTSASVGSFDWGNLINSDSIACNFVVGSTDYVKANSTTDCPDTDAEYALQVTLSPQGVYHNDVSHNTTGDISFIHSTCIIYYGAEPNVVTGETFSGANVGNRPGANCHATVLDTQSTQTITYDSTAPTIDFTTPDEAAGTAYQGSTSKTVTFDATDSVAGFGGTAGWRLQRQIAPITAPNTCGTFANDTATGNLVTGTTSATGQTSSQTLALAKCYRWTLNATDQNGNAATLHTSGKVLVDAVDPATDFTTPNEGATTNQQGTSYSVAWTETDADSGVNTRSLQRQKATYSAGSCGSYSNDGSADTGASPRNNTSLTTGCYRWVQTLTDRAGNDLPITSGIVIVDSNSPVADFSTPNEGTATTQSSTSLSVAWSESAGTGTITARSLQRKKATIVTPGSCEGLTFSNDGAADTGTSPRSQSLTSGNCYIWVQTLTNSGGGVGVSTSGTVLVDATAPTATLGDPDANQPIAGTVTITGTATDAGSFEEYELEYGAGASPGAWTSLGVTSSPVAATGQLGTWSTIALSGVYSLRLTVRDLAGNSQSDTSLVYIDNTPRGSEPRYATAPFDLGGGYELGIGMATGEATLDRDLFSIPSYGPAQALTLHYSSLETTSGRFGYGWLSNLGQNLTYDNGFAIWHRDDGAIVPFGDVGGTWQPLAGHHEAFSHNAGASEDTITRTDRSKLVFSTSTGRLKRLEDRFGNTLALVWNASTATATDDSGRHTDMTIDGSGRTTGATDSAGRDWVFHYDGSGDLDTITDPEGSDTDFAYASHKLTSVTRTRSRLVGGDETITWAIAYTGSQATSVTDPVNTGVANTFAYSAGSTDANLLKVYAGPVRTTTTYTYDELGRMLSKTDPEGYQTTYAYDEDSNLETTVIPIADGESQTIVRGYDASGNVETETTELDDATSVITTMTYDASNDLLTRWEATGESAQLVTRNTYSGGHLMTVNVNCTSSGTSAPTFAGGCSGAGTQNSATNLMTTYSYTANDQLETETDPLGRVTKYTYDSDGNRTAAIADCTSSGTTLPSPGSSCTAAGTADRQTNVITSYAYDSGTAAGKAGLVTTITDPLAQDTDYTYDDLGRQTSEVLPGDGSIPALTHGTAYDELGNVLTDSDDWSGLASPRVSEHIYDKANRETSLTDPSGVVTTTAYDAAGNATSTVSAGVQTDRTFDGVGNLLTETTAGDETTHTYDGRGLELVTTDPELTTTERTYDIAGRLLRETVDGPSDQVTTHEYDLLGRETETTVVADPSVVTTSTYDRPGRLLTVDVDGATTTDAYDRAGNQASVTSPEGILTTTAYDPLDRATAVIVNDVGSPTLPSEDVTTTTYYDAAGTTIAVRDPQGITTRTIANVRGLAASTIANCTDSGTTPTATPPSCTGAGTKNDKTNVFTTTTYDGSGAVLVRVVNDVTSPSQSDEDQRTRTAYDAAGRQLATMDPRGTVTRFVYDGDGRLGSTIVNCTDDTSSPAPPSSAGSWWTCDGSPINDGTWNVTTAKTYDSSGNLATETAPNGRKTTFLYDAANRLVERIDNDVASPTHDDEDLSTLFAYDDAGRQTAVRRPTTDRTTFSVLRTLYDDAGRVVETIDNCTNDGTTPPDSSEWKTCLGVGTQDGDTNIVHGYTYDAMGRKISETEPDPAAAAATGSAMVERQFAYDDDGRLCRVVENATSGTDLQALANPCSTAAQDTGTATANVSTRYTYDGAGNLASMIDARGKTTSYSYDAAGQLLRVTDAEGSTLTYAYDALGQRTSQTDRSDLSPSGATVTWAYDGAGRISTRTHETYSHVPVVDRYEANVTADSPLAYWRLGEPSGATAVDETTDYSGTYHGTVGYAQHTLVADDTDTAIGFNGTTTYITGGADFPLSLTSTNRKTFEAWITPVEAGHTETLFFRGSAAHGYQYWLYWTAGKVGVTVWTSGGSNRIVTDSGADTVPAGQTSHVVVTLDDTIDTVDFWVNGTKVRHVTTAWSGSSSSQSADPIVLGRKDDGATDYYSGVLDEAAIYSSVLSDARIKAHWMAGMESRAVPYADHVTTASPLAYWRLGEASGVTAADVTTDFNGTYSGSPGYGKASRIAGDPDTAVEFNGTTTYIAGGTDSTLSLTSTNMKSFEAWITPVDEASAETLFFRGSAGHGYQYWIYWDDGQLGATVFTSGGSTRINATSGAATVPAGQTSHVVVTLDDTVDQVDFWVNAVRVAHVTTGWSSSSSSQGTDPIVIGRRQDSTDRYFGGVIDEAAIYSSVLSSAQILDHYAAGAVDIDAASTAYTYDANGNKLTAYDGTDTITATYDRIDRVLTVDDEDVGGTADTTYTYDLTDPSWTDPTGSYDVALDAFDREAEVEDPVSGSPFEWTYRADGQPASLAAPNGNTTAFTYDQAGRPATMVTTAAGPTARASYTWTRNAAGQVLSEASTITGDGTNGTTAYQYDALGRLVDYDAATGSDETYAWQATTNRSSKTVGGGGVVTTTYDDANRLVLDSAGSAYVSDADGRLLARPGQRLDYDGLGRLVAVRRTADNATLAAYTYDPLDRLHTVDHAGTIERFRYVGTTISVAQTLDGGGSVTRHIGTDWTGTRLLDWTGAGSNIRVYGTNGHHDVTWTASSAGAITATLRYDPWGTLRASTGASLPEFRFQSSWADATTALSWAVNRWYAPTQATFVTEDSLLGDPMDPPSRHLYAYGQGDPVGAWDPNGLFWYKVARGNTTVGVAARYKVSPTQLASDNYLSAGLIPTGRCIWIRAAGTNQCSPSSSSRVRYSDSLINFRWSFSTRSPRLVYNIGPFGAVFVETWAEYSVSGGQGKPGRPSFTASPNGIRMTNGLSTIGITPSGFLIGGAGVRPSGSSRDVAIAQTFGRPKVITGWHQTNILGGITLCGAVPCFSIQQTWSTELRIDGVGGMPLHEKIEGRWNVVWGYQPWAYGLAPIVAVGAYFGGLTVAGMAASAAAAFRVATLVRN